MQIPTKIPYVLLAFNILGWGGLLWIGIGLLQGVIEQHVRGYPNIAQEILLIGFPTTVVASEILVTVWLLKIGKEGLASALLVILFLALPFYLMMYGGGM